MVQSQVSCRGQASQFTRVAAGSSRQATRTPAAVHQQHRPVLARLRTARAVVCSSTGVDSGQQQATAGNAQQRRESMVRQGTIKNVSTKELGELMKEGWVLLDVRPPNEAERASVVGAVQVPLFYADPDMSPGGLIKKATAFGMGGWWLGGTHMVPNLAFMQQVQQALPDKDAGVVVACQKGLRSLAAAEQLAVAGYQSVAWINGGLDTYQPGDLPTSPDERDLRFAGIGGLSEVLGWTEVQQQEGKEKGGVPLFIKLAAAVLAADLALFAYQQVQFLISGQQ